MQKMISITGAEIYREIKAEENGKILGSQRTLLWINLREYLVNYYPLKNSKDSAQKICSIKKSILKIYNAYKSSGMDYLDPYSITKFEKVFGSLNERESVSTQSDVKGVQEVGSGMLM